MDVGGITVLQRSIKQLGRMSGVKVTIATDGSVELPNPLPANAAVRELGGDVEKSLAALQEELGNPDIECLWRQAGTGDERIDLQEQHGARVADSLGEPIDPPPVRGDASR